MPITPLTQNPVAAAPPTLTPMNVSAAVMKAAANDGDGRTGTAALNDGDAASQTARSEAVDVTA
jgi:hypothetical protein